MQEQSLRRWHIASTEAYPSGFEVINFGIAAPDYPRGTYEASIPKPPGARNKTYLATLKTNESSSNVTLETLKVDQRSTPPYVAAALLKATVETHPDAEIVHVPEEALDYASWREIALIGSCGVNLVQAGGQELYAPIDVVQAQISRAYPELNSMREITPQI